MGAGRAGRRVDLEDFHCGDYAVDGMFYPYSHTSLTSVIDGSSNTLAMGERIHHLRAWIKGGYFVGSRRQYVCIYTSKNIRWPMNSDPDVLCYWNCPNGRTCLFNDLFFESEHPGGAQFVFADGSAHFVHENISFGVYQDLATIAGGEVATWSP